MTLPTTIGEELKTNVFMRPDSAEIRAKLGLAAAATDAEIFAETRRRKDIVQVTLRARDVIAALGLRPHPEGGHFRETWRTAAAPGERSSGTAIYYLLGPTAKWAIGIASTQMRFGTGMAARRLNCRCRLTADQLKP